MDSDLQFIISYITRLVYLHNLLGWMNTLTYDDTFFVQNRLRKIIKGIEDDLGIRKEDFVKISLIPVNSRDQKYLHVDE